MKIVGISDALMDKWMIEKGLEIIEHANVQVEIIHWSLDTGKTQEDINLLIELNGSEAYEVPDYILESVKDADVIVTQFCPINKKVIDTCSKLQVIGVLRAGIENINSEYAEAKGISIINTPGRNANAVADFTIALLLSECRNVARAHVTMKAGLWIRDYANKDRVPDLEDKVVGIIGYGQIGQKVVQRLLGFGVKIIVHDPYLTEKDVPYPLVSLEELMKQSDFVSIHMRLSKDTENMINAKMISLMKPTAYFINTSRAGLVDEEALYEALKNKRIMGAGLDVFKVEPPPEGYPIVQLDNVTLASHLSGGTVDAFAGSSKIFSRRFNELLKSKKIILD